MLIIVSQGTFNIVPASLEFRHIAFPWSHCQGRKLDKLNVTSLTHLFLVLSHSWRTFFEESHPTSLSLSSVMWGTYLLISKNVGMAFPSFIFLAQLPPSVILWKAPKMIQCSRVCSMWSLRSGKWHSLRKTQLSVSLSLSYACSLFCFFPLLPMERVISILWPSSL